MLGYTIDEFLTKSVRDILFEDHLEEELNIFRELLTGNFLSKDFYFCKKDGTGTWATIFTTRVSENLFLTYCLDINDVKEAESELISAKNKAEEMNRLKSYFLANMSHELRTPMIGVLGFSQLMAEDDIADPIETQKMSKLIYSSGRRLMDTLNSILDLSKIESGHSELNYVTFDGIPFLHEITTLYSATAQENNIELNLKTNHKEIMMVSDRKLFGDIINNLVNNAIKFTKSGSVSIIENIIEIDAKEFIKIDVVDTGIGIENEALEFIFDEFRQGSEGLNRSYEGTGLGLTISKKYANLLNGDISVRSKIGEGSTFTVLLPLNNESMIKDNNSINKMTNQESSNFISSFNVLYVEDDDLSVHYVKKILPKNFEVTNTRTCNEAVDIIGANKIDLILMDINLGRGESGLNITKVIKEIPEYSHIPIIACTAYAMLGDKEEFLEAGCDDYISKPYDKNTLIDIINKWVSVKSHNE